MNSISVNAQSISVRREKPSLLKTPLATFEAGWNYIGKSILLTRHALNGVLRSCRWICMGYKQTDQDIRAVILRLKFFSLVSLPLNAPSIVAQAKKIWKGIHIGDREGVFTSSLSITSLLADSLDSIGTFTNALRERFSYAPVAWMSAISLPLTITMLGAGSISRTMRYKQISSFEKELDRELLGKFRDKNVPAAELRLELIQFLKSRFSVSTGEVPTGVLKADVEKLKESILERHTNAKTVELLKQLSNFLESHAVLNDEQLGRVIDTLNEISGALQKEKNVQKGYLLANLVNAVAIVTFSLPVVGWFPFALLTVGFSMRLAMQAYQDFGKLIPKMPLQMR